LALNFTDRINGEKQAILDAFVKLWGKLSGLRKPSSLIHTSAIFPAQIFRYSIPCGEE
jgi:hypothetical protein